MGCLIGFLIGFLIGCPASLVANTKYANALTTTSNTQHTKPPKNIIKMKLDHKTFKHFGHQ